MDKTILSVNSLTLCKFIIMKLHRERDFGKVGIYCIESTINGKKYIGKSINIYSRIKQHITNLNTRSKNENTHFKNAWHKYGRDSFIYYVLEYCDKDEKLLKERELYWIDYYKTIDRKYGYNLRRDSSTGLIITEETRKKLSEAQLKRFSCPEERRKLSETSKRIWLDEDRKKGMIDKLKILNSRHRFYQYTKDGKLLETFETISDILKKYPSLRKQNIYQVCSGQKPSHGGYVWKKELKI